MAHMTYGDRLKLALKYAKKERKELAVALDISVQAVGATIRGETGAMKAENSAKAAAFLRVNPHWLATGEGDMVLENHLIPHFGDVDISSDLQNVTPIAPRKRVPVISWDDVGAWSEAVDMSKVDEKFEYAYKSDPSSRAFALEVQGESMISQVPGDRITFPPGTILVVEPGAPVVAGDFVVATDATTGKATFKKLAYDSGRWFLRPLHPSYPTTEIDDPAKRVVGKVIEFLSGGSLP